MCCSASPLALALPHVLRHASPLREPPSPCRPSSRASTASGLAPRAATSTWTFSTTLLALCHLLALAGQNPGHHHSLRVQTTPRRAGPDSATIVLQPPLGPRLPAEIGSLFWPGPSQLSFRSLYRIAAVPSALLPPAFRLRLPRQPKLAVAFVRGPWSIVRHPLPRPGSAGRSRAGADSHSSPARGPNPLGHIDFRLFFVNRAFVST